MDGTLAPSSRAAACAGSLSDVQWGPEPDWGHPGGEPADQGESLGIQGWNVPLQQKMGHPRC